MFNKNDIQNNFKRQMKELEKDLEQKERGETGAFTNPYYKERFYGYNDVDNKKIIFDKIKRFIFSPIVITIVLLIIFALASTSGDTKNNMIKAYENGNYDEAIKQCDKLLSKTPNDYNALVYKGYSLTSLGNFEEGLDNLKKAEKVDSDADLYYQIGYTCYELLKYEEAIQNLDKAIEMDSKYLDAYIFKGYALVDLQKYDEADICADQIEEHYTDNAYAYNIRGLTQTNRGNYEDGIKNFEKAIQFYDDGGKYEVAYINKVWALYSQQSYSECIEYCNTIKIYFPNNSDISYDIYYYLGDCCSILGEHEKAISAYEEANKLSPEDSILLSRIGFEYYSLEQYDKATQYADEALAVNSENHNATTLSEMVKEAKKPENERIVNFIKKYYLYLDKVSDFDQKAARFLEKKEVTHLDIYEFLESVRLKDDMFTFFVFDEYYDMLLEEELNNKIEHKALSDNIQYIKINSFTLGIDEQFKSVIKKISNPQDQTLVIDLRNNPGGISDAANNMLDLLLPECVTSYMVDRTGEIYSYNSDKAQIAFKHIYIYVNEESASSSELLALGLKTYLKEATVIGRPTVGKGVGQMVFESKKNKYMIFLVECFWNIKEKNVSDQKIQPDIAVKGIELTDYINAMNKHISNNN